MSNPETAEAKKKTYLKIVVDSDNDVENPCGEDGWKFHSFIKKFRSYTDPDEFITSYGSNPMEAKLKPFLAQKMKRGLAHWLSYFEHGDGVWSVRGEGPQCQFDNTVFAGVLIWEQPAGNIGGKTPEARTQDARNFLKVYTDWANGHCYCYTIEVIEDNDDIEYIDEDTEGEEYDSCCGFIGTDNITDAVKQVVDAYMAEHNELTPDDIELIFGGDAKGIVDRHDIFK